MSSYGFMIRKRIFFEEIAGAPLCLLSREKKEYNSSAYNDGIT